MVGELKNHARNPLRWLDGLADRWYGEYMPGPVGWAKGVTMTQIPAYWMGRAQTLADSTGLRVYVVRVGPSLLWAVTPHPQHDHRIVLLVMPAVTAR